MKKELKQLSDFCKSRDIKVKFVGNRILHDYAGTNADAGKAMGFMMNGKSLPHNVILLDEHQSEEWHIQNLKHELRERKLMDEGWTYWDAHCDALKEQTRRFNPSDYIVHKQKIRKPKKRRTIAVSSMR